MAKEKKLTDSENKVYNLIYGLETGSENIFSLVKYLEGINDDEPLKINGKIYDTVQDVERFSTAYVVFLIEHYLSQITHSGSIVASLALTKEYKPLALGKRMEVYKQKFCEGKLTFGKTYEENAQAFDTQENSLITQRMKKYVCLAKSINEDLSRHGKLGFLEAVQRDCDRLLGMIDYDQYSASATPQPSPAASSAAKTAPSFKKTINLIIPVIAVVAIAVTILCIHLSQKSAAAPSPEALLGIGTSGSDELLAKVKKDAIELADKEAAFTKALEGAENGNAEDQFLVGLECYANDDYETAETWLVKAAEQEFVPAQSMLCLLYDHNAVGGAEEALYSWAERAYGNHDAMGCYMLGICYFCGYHVDRSYDDAKDLFQHVIDGKDRDGEPLQESLFAYGGITAKPLAQCRLGDIYMFGLGSKTEISYAKALNLYTAAYENGYMSAAISIGRIYQQGLGVEADEETAQDWYERGGLPRGVQVGGGPPQE